MFEISELFLTERKKRKSSLRAFAIFLGLKKTSLQNIENGCNFVLDDGIVAAIKTLGHELILKKVGDK